MSSDEQVVPTSISTEHSTTTTTTTTAVTSSSEDILHTSSISTLSLSFTDILPLLNKLHTSTSTSTTAPHSTACVVFPPPVTSLCLKCLSTSKLLEITNSKYKTFKSRCFTGLQLYAGSQALARVLMAYPQIIQNK